ncbi:peptide/nickel transport system substrate-binding protein [Amycolatopsis sulphurea]|uniref:Peptide/nickel transport system substrate-binding protein n=1 Tax=Amycolatopsis sulphurea TaxID=76022 RepID=A0A2A9G1A6_9PSEU|nr:ABC transporter substrate-binding protein [Amycolatopsis sulphurea]PFG57507.1 peptide/nickel transport system substrate-binding protein [Amycolatopsis sulphurea]
MGYVRRVCTIAAVGTLGVLPTAGIAAAQQHAQQPAPEPAQPKVLRVALTTGIDHLNPFTASLAASTQVGRFIYEFLTIPSAEKAAAAPALAESWRISPDKLTWTFKIRQGAKWSDGQPITAKDPAFTFNRMLTDETARTANGNYVANFASVTAPDDATLVIRTKTVQATMDLLDVPIVPEHIWAPIKDLTAPETDTVPVVGVDDGPYRLTEYKQNEYLKFAANKGYWRGAPKVDELQLLVFKDVESAVNALKQGEVDVLNRLTPTQFDALKDRPDIATNQAPGRRYNEITLNFGVQNAQNQPIGNGNPVLKDIRLRQAIAQTIDPKTVVDKVMGGYGQLGGGVIPPIYQAYHWDPPPDQARGFDLAKANAALDAAGYRKGGDGLRTEPGGARLELRLTGHANRGFDQRVAQYVSGWLHDIGISVKQELVSDEELNDRTNAGNYDLAISGYATNPDPDYALSLHTCAARPNAQGKGGTTDTFFCDPQYDQLYAQQLAETDPAARAGYVKRAQARLSSQAVNVVLDYDNALEAYRSDRFSSFGKQPQPDGPILEQTGYWGVYGAVPAVARSGDSAANTGLWIVLGVVAAVALFGSGYTLGRRRAIPMDDRE